MTYIFFLSVQ